MSNQQAIYVVGSENRPPMLNKDNYVPWSSRLLRYAKSKPNEKLIYNSIMNHPYVRRMILEPVDPGREAEVNEMRAERLARAHDPLALMENSNNSYNYPVFHQDQSSSITYMQQPQPNNNFILRPSFNTNYMQQPMPNPKDIKDPTTAMNMELVLMDKAFKLNCLTPTNNNQIISSNHHNRQMAPLDMNLGQDRQMQIVRGNGGNQFRQYAGQNVGNLNGYNEVQNVRNPVVQNAVKNLDYRLKVMVMGTTKIRYGVTTVEDLVILLGTTQSYQEKGMLLIFRHRDLNKIEEVNANCILMAILQQASTLDTQIDKAPVYDLDRSAEILYDKACNDMQQKIEHLQAWLGDLKGKIKDTLCKSDSLDPLSQKLLNENVELEFQDAKKLLEAVEKRFGGNAATKKTQRNLIKQQYENFTAPSSEMLDQTFDRLQKLVNEFVNKPVFENYKAKSSEEEPKVVKKNDDVPIIENGYEAVHKELGDRLVRAATTASSLEAEQDSGRIADIDANEDIYLVNVHNDEDMFGVNDLDGDEVIVENVDVVEQAKEVVNDITLAKALKEIKKRLVDEELAFKLQAKKEEERLDREKAQQIEEVNISWDDVQAKIDTDYELAQRLQAEEQEELTDAKKAKLFMVNTFEDFRTELVEGKEKKAGTEPIQEITKKQKIEDDKETTRLKQFIEIITDDEEVAINAIALAVKSLMIVD
uniref:Ribonuclease H-like domain-containing protein n=1 Tax=Tanacetum cinerariifolium TaxID=118510 RepID=A0A6L2JEF2_TANCI|nr:ribonuclease H-like domain-containing protein [Tanacetum cinerariifolium]